MRYGSVLAALVAALAFAAAGCGGGDDNGGGGGAEGSEDVSGSISTMAIWAGEEQESFQAVIDAFEEKFPNVSVNYTSGATTWRRCSRRLSRAATRRTSPQSASLA